MDKRTMMLAHIDACTRSGLSQKEYCQEHGISYSTFGYYRMRQLRALQDSSVAAPGFLPVHVEPPQAKTPFELVYPSGAFLRIPADVSTEELKALINL
jgi:hypothetical protein